MLGQDALGFELRAVGRGHIHVFPLGDARGEEPRALRPEPFFHVGADFIAARADRRAERDEKGAWIGTRGDQGSHGLARDFRYGAPPSRVGGGDAAVNGIRDQHRQAVGGLDGEERSRVRGPTGVGIGRLGPWRRHDRA